MAIRKLAENTRIRVRLYQNRPVLESLSLAILTACAEMAELVDAPDSKFGGVSPRVGSSPTLGTTQIFATFL